MRLKPFDVHAENVLGLDCFVQVQVDKSYGLLHQSEIVLVGLYGLCNHQLEVGEKVEHTYQQLGVWLDRW